MKCTNCFAEVPDNSVYCNNCGHQLKKLAGAPAPVQGRGRKSGRLGVWIVGILAVMFLGVAGFAVYYFFLSTPGGAPVSQAAAPSNTPVPPTETPLPTREPTNTSTVTPTREPTRTPTVTPTPTPPAELPPEIASYFRNPVVLEYYDFTSLSEEDWSFSGGENVMQLDAIAGQNGGIRMVGSDPFGTYLIRNQTIQEWEAILIQFIYNGDQPGLEFMLDCGEWGTDSYRRFGFGVYDSFLFTPSIWQSAENFSADFPLAGSLQLYPGRTYQLLLIVGPDSDFVYGIWEGYPNNRMVITDLVVFSGFPPFGDTWDDLDWNFVIQVDNDTTLIVLSYLEFTFDGIVK